MFRLLDVIIWGRSLARLWRRAPEALALDLLVTD